MKLNYLKLRRPDLAQSRANASASRSEAKIKRVQRTIAEVLDGPAGEKSPAKKRRVVAGPSKMEKNWSSLIFG